MADSVQPPNSDWFREWAEQQNRKREEVLIQLELPLPELLESPEEPAVSDRGVYQDALKSVIDDAIDSCVVNTTTFQF